MKGDTKLLDTLNEILTLQLTCINQYFIHAKMLKNFGYAGLAGKKYHASIDEMKAADKLIERILLLEGVPNLQRLGSVRVGENPVEMHEVDLKAATLMVEKLNAAVQQASDLGDNGSRLVLEAALEEEEEFVDWLEAQLSLVQELGRERYLAEMIGKS